MAVSGLNYERLIEEGESDHFTMSMTTHESWEAKLWAITYSKQAYVAVTLPHIYTHTHATVTLPHTYIYTLTHKKLS